MLMVLFSVGDQRYAFPCEHVIEVVPRVDLAPIAHAPDDVAGMLNFRGVPVPVVDFCRLLEGTSCQSRLHTRIIVLKYPNPMGGDYLFGVVGERVTETVYRNAEDFVDAGVRMKDVPYLGGVMTEGDRVTQFVLIDELFAMLQPTLFSVANGG